MGFGVRVRVKILKLAWKWAHLCQLGVEEPPAYLTHSSWRLVLPAPLSKLTLIHTNEFKEILLFFFFFFTRNIFAVNSSLSFTVTITAPNLFFVRLM